MSHHALIVLSRYNIMMRSLILDAQWLKSCKQWIFNSSLQEQVIKYCTMTAQLQMIPDIRFNIKVMTCLGVLSSLYVVVLLQRGRLFKVQEMVVPLYQTLTCFVFNKSLQDWDNAKTYKPRYFNDSCLKRWTPIAWTAGLINMLSVVRIFLKNDKIIQSCDETRMEAQYIYYLVTDTPMISRQIHKS